MNIDKDYNRIASSWDKIYSSSKISVPNSKNTNNKGINECLDWICSSSKRILDFGCGNGSISFYCGLRGVDENIGMDISELGIELANKRKQLMNIGKYEFLVGDVKSLQTFEDNYFDGVIIFNTLDNLLPVDANLFIKETQRIVKADGKILIKLNPYLSNEDIKTMNIKVIDNNLLDDGLYLYNLTNEEWISKFNKYFIIEDIKEILYEQYNQVNRLFMLRNKGDE